MAVARYPVTVVDCDDPLALARFWAAVLDWRLEEHDDFVELVADHGDRLAFQRAEGYRAPRWPGQEAPQQMHLDVTVDDLDVGEAVVIGLGATRHEHQPGETFRVFLDPAGHPFCLCLS